MALLPQLNFADVAVPVRVDKECYCYVTRHCVAEIRGWANLLAGLLVAEAIATTSIQALYDHRPDAWAPAEIFLEGGKTTETLKS